jgi:hypothetical protein
VPGQSTAASLQDQCARKVPCYFVPRMLAAAKAGKEDGFGLISGSAIIAPTSEIAVREELTGVGLWYRIKTEFTNI